MGARTAWVVAGGGIVLLVLLAGARPAAAELDGPCSASGTFDNGVTVDPAASDGPFEVPLEGTVEWSGQIGDGGETEPRAHEGAIAVVAPPGFDQLLGGLLEFRDWGEDDAETTAESGSETYELPSITPRGVDVVVTGFHDDELGRCDGRVTLRVEGGAFDSPLTLVSVAGTVGAGAGVAAAAVARRPR